MSWRKVHLFLALISGAFLFLASITGAILACEPLFLHLNAVAVSGSDSLSIAELMATLNEKFIEVFSIARDAYGNVKIEAIGLETDGTLFINPLNGEVINPPDDLHPIFSYCRDLHRSLYLKTPGRLIVGLSSLALLVLCISGIGLLFKRVGDWKSFFHKIIVLDFKRDNHARFSRLFIIPIFLMTLSAVILFFDRFLDTSYFNPISNEGNDILKTQQESDGQNVFQNIFLEDLNELHYPISDDEGEYFLVKLQNEDLWLHPKTGELIRREKHSIAAICSDISYRLHTGEGWVLWSILMLITSIVVLFLSYTGLLMFFTKRTSNISNVLSIDEAEFVILVGSETGQTKRFAKTVHQSLLAQEYRSYICEMNDVTAAPQMKHLLVFTSTYGNGESPSNASGFLKNLKNGLFKGINFSYSVIGFGSKSYPLFCQYAKKVDQVLGNLTNGSPGVNLSTVNDLSIAEFKQWFTSWIEKKGLPIHLDTKKLEAIRKKNCILLKVIKRRESKNLNNLNFLLELEIPVNHILESGDLIAIYPFGSNIERYYSMAVNSATNTILLSVKRTGLCSEYLGKLVSGDVIEGYFKENPTFHFPPSAKSVLMVANGTGIAPFLGMIKENKNNVPTNLYWGIKDESYYQLCKNDLLGLDVKLAISSMADKLYVQNLIHSNHSDVVKLLSNYGVIMICGSLKMQEGVLAELEFICTHYCDNNLNFYVKNKQILMDCY